MKQQEKDTKQAVIDAKKKLHAALGTLKFLHEQGEGEFIRDEMLHAGLNFAGHFDFEAIDKLDCGTFEIVKTRRDITFKTYTGYSVTVAQYTPTPTGEAAPQSLYLALDEHMSLTRTVEGHEDEPFGEDGSVNKGELLEGNKIVISANLLRPLTVFTDYEEATKAADQQLAWLDTQIQQMLEVSQQQPATEDTAIDAEEAARVAAGETLKSTLDGAEQASAEGNA